MIFEIQKSDLVRRQSHTQPTPAPRVYVSVYNYFM